MPKTVFKAASKKRAQKKSKTVDGRQNQRIKKLEQLVLPAIERKSRDINAFGALISTSGYANQPIFQLEQGDANNQRIGDKVTLLSHQVSMALASQDNTQTIRVMFIVTPSTTALSISDVLEYGNYTTHGDAVFSSPYKRKANTAENTYKVMFDKVYHFRSNQRVLTDKYELVPKKGGKQVQFQSAGSVMPENYQLQILAISDSSAAPHPAISYTVRSKYLDM